MAPGVGTESLDRRKPVKLANIFQVVPDRAKRWVWNASSMLRQLVLHPVGVFASTSPSETISNTADRFSEHWGAKSSRERRREEKNEALTEHGRECEYRMLPFRQIKISLRVVGSASE
jgi:hypothetical protein